MCSNTDINRSTCLQFTALLSPPYVMPTGGIIPPQGKSRPVSEQFFLDLCLPNRKHIYAGTTCQHKLVLCVNIYISLGLCYPAPQRAVQALLLPELAAGRVDV